ncbi:MAG: LysE family transporter [Parvularculales bacterium]
MVGTPGPANMLMMSAAVRHGYLKLLPFLLGLIIGKFAINISISFGLATFLFSHPHASSIFAYISAGVMTYLVLKGWTPKGDSAAGDKAFGILTGVIVHPLNPKAWVMCTLAYTQFSGGFETGFERYALIPISFIFVQLTFHSLWGLAGALLKKQLSENLLMHRALILLTLAVILWALFR